MDRRDFLTCVEWVGTGAVWTMAGGVQFIGLVNVQNLKAGGVGSLGDEQLEWLERDAKGLKSSTPIVVFAHIPLWSVYPEWGWGTDDSARALAYLKRFGSVSVLNGHIHQVMQKVEGNVTFHTAMSTAFPQPAPGTAPSPGPMKVEADRLKKVLGITRIAYHDINHPIAITDVPLDEGMTSEVRVAGARHRREVLASLPDVALRHHQGGMSSEEMCDNDCMCVCQSRD